MRVPEAKFNLVFVVKDILNARKTIVHAQRMLPYRVTHRGEQASAELKQQAEHYDTTYPLVDSIWSIWKKRGKHEMLVGWLGLERREDDTWEPIEFEKEEMLCILEDFLATTSDGNVKREVLDLYFLSKNSSVQSLWGTVICCLQHSLEALLNMDVWTFGPKYIFLYLVSNLVWPLEQNHKTLQHSLNIGNKYL